MSPRCHWLHIRTYSIIYIYLIFGSSNWLGESKERESEIDETVFVRLQLLVSPGNLEKLQTHQPDDQGRRRGDGWYYLPRYPLAL